MRNAATQRTPGNATRDPMNLPENRSLLFGPFTLIPHQQLLLDGDKRIRLASRALEILIALVKRPGELVTKQELMTLVWPDTTVVEANLTVHVSTLRRTLGDGQGGNRYIVNVPGRGYRFVAPITFEASLEPPTAPAAKVKHNLPTQVTSLIGRAATVGEIVKHQQDGRLITIAGPGGIGKTRVALRVAEELIDAYQDGVWFVDLSAISAPGFVATMLGTVLNLEFQSSNPMSALTAALADKKALLFLDNCEHVIDATAELVTGILRGTRQVSVLATSREPLSVRGELVYRLSPLDFPDSSKTIGVENALRFPAVQLFVERTAEAIGNYELTDADVPYVAEICRRLEGVPLAIEFAAARVTTFGVSWVAERLDDRLRLLNVKRRGTPTRHHTITATLDWSYQLLNDDEQRVLRRLAIFSGGCTLDAAVEVTANGNDQKFEIADIVDSLIAKSLVTPEMRHGEMRLRLLETIRAYSLAKLIQSGELGQLERRHAEYFRDNLEHAQIELETRPNEVWLSVYGDQVDDIRTALSWAFSPRGDPALGVALTVAAVPLWFRLSLIDECRSSVERALAALADQQQDDRRKMQLFAALGWSQIYVPGPTRETGAGSARALELAEALDDTDYKLRATWGLWAGSQDNGDFKVAFELAERFREIAATSSNPSDSLVGDRMLAATLHFLGRQADARRHIEHMLAHYIRPNRFSDIIRFKFDQQVTARSTFARVLWLQGYADRAMREVQTNVEHALSINHSLSLCNTLVQAAVPIAILVGDMAAAERLNSMLIYHTERQGLNFWRAHRDCFKGQILMMRRDFDAGLELCRAGLAELRKSKSLHYLTSFLAAVAEGSANVGHLDAGFAAIDEALSRCEHHDERWCLPDLLRIKGKLVLRDSASGAVEAAESYFLRSLDLARQQGSLSWELRAATSLARLWAGQRRIDEARDLLMTVSSQFDEGFGTADFRAAVQLRDAIA